MEEIYKQLKEPDYKDLSSFVLDLTPAFDGNEYIYIDDIHVSPNGNGIIADKILLRIIANKKLTDNGNAERSLVLR